jgi:diguanylate cyclase (GGDEF)-like protein/PAS domain S-box-containing protein
MIEDEYIWYALKELDINALFFVDTEGVIRYTNKGVTSLFGYSSHDLIGKTVELLLPRNIRKLHQSIFSNYVKRRRKEEQIQSRIIGVQRIFPATTTAQNHGLKRFTAINVYQEEIPITLIVNEVRSDSGGLIGFVAIIQDNTEQHHLLQKFRYRMLYDELTGLINWPEFQRQAHEIKKNTLKKNMNYYASILYVDIDYFRTVSFKSRRAGDYAIKKVATWLLNRTRQKEGRGLSPLITHFVNGEFILYLPNTSIEDALTLARSLKSEFLQLNLRTSTYPFYTSLSIGVKIITARTALQEAVIQALSACRLAKEKGKDKIQVAQEEDTHYQKLEPLIREALLNRRLKLYAQKIVAISPYAKSIDKGWAHYEILSRMEDKEGHIISPVLFIPAAEKLGLAIAIDMYVIERTLSLLQHNSCHVRFLSLCSINLSGISVSNERMLPFIERQISKSGIDPRKLCFEITETNKIRDNDTARYLVTKLRKVGCKFAFDDFGIGYSNYQSFSRLPVDIIKIDGSYIQHILEDSRLRADVKGMINSAKSRGLEIVAEYAEKEEIVAELERFGVDYAQGYYFSKPEPIGILMEEIPRAS